MRKILEEILHDDVSIERDQLYARLDEVLPKELEFYVVLVERRRFAVSKADFAAEQLFLPFLSFGRVDGNVVTFDNPRAVAEFVEEARENGTVLAARPKSLIIADPLDPAELELATLVESILISYYYACGHYENFMSNASRRFGKSFLREGKALTTDRVMEAITSYTRCEAMYLVFQGPFGEASPQYDPNNTFPWLMESRRFARDLSRAVEMRSVLSGRTERGDNYIISVATDDRSYQNLTKVEVENVKASLSPIEKRHVLVLSNSGVGIPMDAVKFGPGLFNMLIDNERSSARERVIFNIYEAISEVERRFVGDPPRSRTEIDTIISEHLVEVLVAATQFTAAELLVARLHDPFTDELVSKAVVTRGAVLATGVTEEISVPDDKPAANCFRSLEPIRAFTDVPPIAQKLRRGARDEVVGCAFPFRIGQLTRGVLECYSTRIGQLQFDETYLRAVADAIGDAVRRLESAADVAWISRLSFLHSARHELENFLPLLANSNRPLYESLRSTLDRYSGFGPSPWQPDGPALARQVGELFKDAQDDPAESEALVAQIGAIESALNPDVGFKFIFAEVMTTLVSNARKHSALRAQDFSVEYAEHAGAQAISLTYRAAGKRIEPERADQVATAPIPDEQRRTFHYGLFMLAAQVRMNGGAVFVNTNAEVEFDTIPFEISFILPVHPLGIANAD